jgi:hypothetical protein
MVEFRTVKRIECVFSTDTRCNMLRMKRSGSVLRRIRGVGSGMAAKWRDGTNREATLQLLQYVTRGCADRKTVPVVCRELPCLSQLFFVVSREAAQSLCPAVLLLLPFSTLFVTLNKQPRAADGVNVCHT